ncbi:hypothetical protein DL96DRAFT_1681870 [Flagelloscypha sp. PMI_526]|nr:hypothetical protein DL96DRAFT_1681870 [Flagelloscypha sp. PMI_526]
MFTSRPFLIPHFSAPLYLPNFFLSLALLMHIFAQHTLWIPFEHLSDPNAMEFESALSVKAIVDRSNVVITCNGILCGMVYQQTYPSGPLNNASKVLVTMSLLIVTWNRLQYESHFINELKTRVQQTGPLLPTLRYIVPEILLAILLILEGFKAGGAAGATIIALLFVVLLSLGWILSMKQERSKETGKEVIGRPVGIA